MLTIDPFRPGDELAFSALVRRVFDEFVAPSYTAEGNRSFYEHIDPARILERHRGGNLLLAARHGDAIVGIIEMRERNHVCLLFVEKAWQGKGVAKRLFFAALQRCRLVPEPPPCVEVNASPNSVAIYEKLGFRQEGEVQERSGMKFVSMRTDSR
jgi:GNAT superfamily N-acetyltransferase